MMWVSLVKPEWGHNKAGKEHVYRKGQNLGCEQAMGAAAKEKVKRQRKYQRVEDRNGAKQPTTCPDRQRKVWENFAVQIENISGDLENRQRTKRPADDCCSFAVNGNHPDKSHHSGKDQGRQNIEPESRAATKPTMIGALLIHASYKGFAESQLQSENRKERFPCG
ncbi:MAG: hypothetical protein V4710_00415 [Verrucomicrobiota bacterium]